MPDVLMTGSSSGPWTREDLRDAVQALYTGTMMPRDVPNRFNGVSRQRVSELVAQLDEDLVDDEQRLSLRRAANCAAGFDSRERCYTDWELRTALKVLKADYAKTMQRKDILSVYRVPQGTIKNYLIALRVAGKEKRAELPSVEDFNKEVDALEIGRRGGCCCAVTCPAEHCWTGSGISP